MNLFSINLVTETVNMPAFLGGDRKQMTKDGVFHTQEIASERIHIERTIINVENFHIFDSCILLAIIGSILFFENPIISGVLSGYAERYLYSACYRI